MLNKHENWRKESKKVNYKSSDRMKRIMKVLSEILSLEEEEGGFFTVKLQEYSPK
jgi:hypothetical protein